MSWEKYRKVQNFSLPMEKEVTNIYKDGNESVVTLSYKIEFTDSARFIASSLSNLVDNLAEGIHKIKYKCLSCNKDFSNKLDKKLTNWFKNTFKFSNNDINKFIYQANT